MPNNIIAANNQYDVKYIKYHTGLDAIYLPSWCGIISKNAVSYNPSRSEYLLGPYRDNLDFPLFRDPESWKHPILQGLTKAIYETGTKFIFKRMRTLYDPYKIEDLIAHPAIILIPYQVSSMSFFEFYRLNIPIFAPDLDLLVSWESNYKQIRERVYGHPPRMISNPDTEIADPNNSTTTAAIKYWLQFSDIYVFPHIRLFKSWKHLIQLLQETDLQQVSRHMREHNEVHKTELKNKWKEVFHKISPHPGIPNPFPNDFNTAMKQLYNIEPMGPDPPNAKKNCDY